MKFEHELAIVTRDVSTDDGEIYEDAELLVVSHLYSDGEVEISFYSISHEKYPGRFSMDLKRPSLDIAIYDLEYSGFKLKRKYSENEVLTELLKEDNKFSKGIMKALLSESYYNKIIPTIDLSMSNKAILIDIIL